MNIKKRLHALEFEADRQASHDAGRFEASQRDLCCPLPEKATLGEKAEAFKLLTAGQAAIRQDRTNQGPLLAFRDFAIGLHRKYNGPFAAEELSNA